MIDGVKAVSGQTERVEGGKVELTLNLIVVPGWTSFYTEHIAE